MLMDPDEAAKRLGIKRRKLIEMAREGKIPRVKIGHAVRFKVEDIEKFIELNRDPGSY